MVYDTNSDYLEFDENKTSDLPYYYSNVDRTKSEYILRLMNRPGCFLIRQHQHESLSSLVTSPYVLSIVSPSLKILHYLIYRINQRLFLKPYSDEFYNSVKSLVDAHQQNPGILPCTLVEYPVRLVTNNDDTSSVSTTISSSSSSLSLNIQQNQVVRQEIIGQGHFGIVYKGLYGENISVAIKTFSASSNLTKEECESNMLCEAQMMMQLRHPYLVHLYGISRIDHQLSLITEYVSNGCLLFWLQQQQQQQQQLPTTKQLGRRLILFSLQICSAMVYLESKLIIHRDLAARNCLIDDQANVVKVSDFGMARLVSTTSTSMSLSSSMIYEGRCDKPFPLRWSSPEVLLYRQYSSKSDVWSYGILLWEMFSLGGTPFGESTSNDLVVRLIRLGRMPNKPPLAKKLIHQKLISPCWTYNADERPSFSSLKHTFDKILSISARSDAAE